MNCFDTIVRVGRSQTQRFPGSKDTYRRYLNKLVSGTKLILFFTPSSVSVSETVQISSLSILAWLHHQQVAAISCQLGQGHHSPHHGLSYLLFYLKKIIIEQLLDLSTKEVTFPLLMSHTMTQFLVFVRTSPDCEDTRISSNAKSCLSITNQRSIFTWSVLTNQKPEFTCQ